MTRVVSDGGKANLRGSMGWAASPIRTSLPLCHEEMGARKRRGHFFISLAFLYCAALAKSPKIVIGQSRPG